MVKVIYVMLLNQKNVPAIANLQCNIFEYLCIKEILHIILKTTDRETLITLYWQLFTNNEHSVFNLSYHI